MSPLYNPGKNQTIFNLIGQSAALDDILDAVTNWLEINISDALVSVMLYSEQDQVLNLRNTPNYFSNFFLNALKNLKIGPHVGACGAAAFHRKLVVCENLFTDSNWMDYKDLAKQEGLNACWAAPILSANGKLYGTLATYFRTVKSPTAREINLLQYAASLIALTMDLYKERKKRIQLKDKYESLFSFHPDAIFEHDLQGRIIDANFATKNIFNEAGVQSLIGSKINHFIEPDYRTLALEAFELAKQGGTGHIKVEAHNTIGGKYWIDLIFLPIKVQNEIVGIFAIVRDITERYQNNEMLRLMKRSVDAASHGIVLTSAKNDQQIEYVNPAFEQITGYTLDELIGKNCRILQGVETSTVVVSQIRKAIQEKSEIKVILKNYRKDGSCFWNELSVGPVFDESQKCTHFIGIQQDITQKVAQQEMIVYQQSHDNLTGLINHKKFKELLDSKFYCSNSKHTSLVLLYIDLDDFTPLKQSLGPEIGDKILKFFADRLVRILHSKDVLSRFNGDEFAILLNDVEDHKQIIVLVEKILKEFSQPFEVDGHNIHISASIGIVDDNPNIENVRQFLNAAVDAMRDAQAEGGNTWSWCNFAKNQMPKIDYVRMRHELMIALQEQQFKMVYQPIIDVKTGKVKSLEALIRWQHPEKGFISPIEFIPFAERTGQIIAIGEWVLRQTCKEIKAWNDKYNTNVLVAVNLSPLQFRRSGFLQDLHHILVETEFPSELLKLEVTESMLIAGADKSLAILKDVRGLGIKVSVDDFGTGYSSLSYLRNLPVDEIKLDRSFIEFLPENKQDEAIVEAIIVMAHKLDLKVVAEGIETAQQAECLKQLECDYFQGFYYAKPTQLDQLKWNYELLFKKSESN